MALAAAAAPALPLDAAAPAVPWESLTPEEQGEILRIVIRARARGPVGDAAQPALPQPAQPAPPARSAALGTPQGTASAGHGAEAPGALGRPVTASLTWRNLAFSLDLPGGGKKTILEPCSGHLGPGQLVAIMGPSGCGKTTLLDMLAMKKTSKYQGEVYVNGHIPEPGPFRRIAAYVGQDDRMPPFWRVREAIEFNARLKQPAGAAGTRRAVSDMVGVLLEEFGLAEVANTYIGGPHVRGISGGQRRRVSIARGLAARAPLLFCDEPTSGLSATDAELCVKSLKAITKKLRVLALVVIHQPRVEVAELFDRLLLLTSSPGRMVYFGPMAAARLYFQASGYQVPEHANPADVFLDLVTPGSHADASDALAHAYATQQRPAVEREVEAAIANKGETVLDLVQALRGEERDGRAAKAPMLTGVGPRAAPIRVQVAAVLARKVKITMRNPMAGALTVLIPCGMGTLLGCVFQGVAQLSFLQQVSFFFILVTGAGFQSMGFMPGLIEERTYMKYETSEALYAEWVNALANLCVDIPLALVGAGAQVSIAYLLSGLSGEYFQVVFVWTLLLFFFYDSLFACIAACSADAQTAQLVATPFLTIFMLFNGFVVSRGGAPVWLRWIFEVSPNYYTMQNIITKVGEGSQQGELVVRTFGYTAGCEMQAAIVMTCGIVVLRAGQVLALRVLHNIQR